MELSVIITAEGEKIPVLLDDKMYLVKPVFDFLKFQRLKNMAENTIKTYGWDDTGCDACVERNDGFNFIFASKIKGNQSTH